MIYSTSIIVRTRKEMIHRYVDAPKGVEYLKDYHRHMLHIEVDIEVYHDDRELEFILVKRDIEAFLERYPLQEVEKSCEMVAFDIIEYVVAKYGDRNVECKVFEDGENGARVARRRSCNDKEL